MTTPLPQLQPQDRITRFGRLQSLGVFVLLLMAIHLVAGPKLQLSQWTTSTEHNAAIAEAMAWRAGRLDIPHEGRDAAVDRIHDTAWFKGRVYNVFPPLMTFLSYAVAPLNQWLFNRPDFWQPTLYALIVYGPLPLLGFMVFRRQAGNDLRGAILTLAWIAGSPLLPSLGEARGAYLGSLDHVFSQTGLLLLIWDVLGRRRIWPGVIGLAMAVWSRQMTALYAPALLWAAWKGTDDGSASLSPEGRPDTSRPMRIAGALLGLGLIAAPLLTLNYLKFGSPLEFGYGYIYENRASGYVEDRFRAHGVFSTHFMRDNAYYQLVAPPSVELDMDGLRISDTNNIGTGICLTTPLVLWIVLSAGGWWRDAMRRMLVLCSLAAALGVMCYHSPGFLQNGYSRFALDYLPVWLAAAAPCMFDRSKPGNHGGLGVGWGWRNWLTAGCIAWSLLYFHTITPNAFVRVEVQ